MQIVLLVAAAALFGAAIVVLIIALRRARKPKTPPTRQDPLKFGEMPRFGPRQLGPGAIVSYGGVDYVVRGSVTYREGPFVWWEHLIEGGTGEPIWFSVEEDEGRLELAMWAAATAESAVGRIRPCSTNIRLVEEPTQQFASLVLVDAGVGIPALDPQLIVQWLADDLEDRLLC